MVLRNRKMLRNDMWTEFEIRKFERKTSRSEERVREGRCAAGIYTQQPVWAAPAGVLTRGAERSGDETRGALSNERRGQVTMERAGRPIASRRVAMCRRFASAPLAFIIASRRVVNERSEREHLFASPLLSPAPVSSRPTRRPLARRVSERAACMRMCSTCVQLLRRTAAPWRQPHWPPRARAARARQLGAGEFGRQRPQMAATSSCAPPGRSTVHASSSCFLFVHFTWLHSTRSLVFGPPSRRVRASRPVPSIRVRAGGRAPDTSSGLRVQYVGFSRSREVLYNVQYECSTNQNIQYCN